MYTVPTHSHPKYNLCSLAIIEANLVEKIFYLTYIILPLQYFICTYDFNFINIYLYPPTYISTNIGTGLQPDDSKTLDTGLTFRCTRPVAYQLHETAGELLKTQVFASPSRRLRGYALIGSDRKNRKRHTLQVNKCKNTVTLFMQI